MTYQLPHSDSSLSYTNEQRRSPSLTDQPFHRRECRSLVLSILNQLCSLNSLLTPPQISS